MTERSFDGRDGVRAVVRGMQTLLPPDDALGWSASSVDVLLLDVHDAALLHRDPPAERSRLVTRRFVAAAAKQWFVNDPQRAGSEVLCAQMIVTRFASGADAALAEADGWSELHAGGAAFENVDHSGQLRRVAVILEDRLAHAVGYSRTDDVTFAAAVSHEDPAIATAAVAVLLA